MVPRNAQRGIHAGCDANVCGSADFNAAFLKMWQRDGFRDYLHPAREDVDGLSLLEAVTLDEAPEYEEEDALPEPPPSAQPVRAPRGTLRVSDLNKLLENRADIADLLDAQLRELGLGEAPAAQ